MTTHSMMLLPPRPGVCQECAVAHAEDAPHDATSLYYRTKFHMDHGRSPNWIDAMAHCADDTKAGWIQALHKSGIDATAGEVYPKKKGTKKK